MGRKRQLQFGAINITMPAPHRPERYIELFRQAGELDKVVKLKGDWVGKLGTLLGDHKVNVANFTLGRAAAGAEAIAIAYLDAPLAPEVVKELEATGLFQQVKPIEFLVA